jgi:hypothetical protein
MPSLSHLLLPAAAAASLLLLLRARAAARAASSAPAAAFFAAGACPGARLVIVTCRELAAAGGGASASWAVAGLDELALYRACAAAGLRFHVRAWDDAAVDWASYDLALVRTTWDYSASEARCFAFTQWLGSLARARVRVLNHERVLAWNAHKAYLAEVGAWWGARGGAPSPELEVAAIPSVCIAAGTPRGAALDLRALMAARGWRDVLLKPAVGGGSRACLRLLASEGQAGLAAAQAFLERHVLGSAGGGGGSASASGVSRAALVRGWHHPATSAGASASGSDVDVDALVREAASALQEGMRGGSGEEEHVPPQDMLLLPYLATVETAGELSLVVIDGAVSHAVRKQPAPGQFRCQEEFAAVSSAVPLTPALRRLAENVLAGALAVVAARQPALAAPLSPASAPYALPAPLPPSALLLARVDLLPLTPALHAAVYGADGRGAGGERVPDAARTPYLVLEIGACGGGGSRRVHGGHALRARPSRALPLHSHPPTHTRLPPL